VIKKSDLKNLGRRRRKAPETGLSHAIQMCLATNGVMFERIQTGAHQVLDPNTGKLYWIRCADEGCPDLWTEYGFLEVKRPGERLSPKQRQWHAKAKARGVVAAVVRSAFEAQCFVTAQRRARSDLLASLRAPFRPPPLPEAGAHEAARAAVQAMSAAEKRQTLIDSGIIDTRGRLTKHYGGPSDS
jgi:hypothetical protein